MGYNQQLIYNNKMLFYTVVTNTLASFYHRQCGLRPPTNPLEVVSSGNIMLVNLVTDETRRPGFKAVYTAIPATTGKTCNRSVQML